MENLTLFFYINCIPLKNCQQKKITGNDTSCQKKKKHNIKIFSLNLNTTFPFILYSLFLCLYTSKKAIPHTLLVTVVKKIYKLFKAS